MRLAVIGGGNMGGAIAKALLQKQLLLPHELLIIELDAQKRQQFSQELKCLVQETLDFKLGEAEAILLAVKPQSARVVMERVSPWLRTEQLVISIMAGVSIQTLTTTLQHAAVIRVMPNTPAQIAEGMSVYFAAAAVSSQQRELTEIMLSSCGRCLEVPHEDAIDAATAVSGSGPAYLFYLAEQLIMAAQSLGFSEETAQLLVQQTLRGAVLLWEQSAQSAAKLRQQVTSPGGTTAAALHYFEQQQTGYHLQQGVRQAYQRARELA